MQNQSYRSVIKTLLPVAARGENGREGCEVSSLVEYIQ